MSRVFVVGGSFGSTPARSPGYWRAHKVIKRMIKRLEDCPDPKELAATRREFQALVAKRARCSSLTAGLAIIHNWSSLPKEWKDPRRSDPTNLAEYKAKEAEEEAWCHRLWDALDGRALCPDIKGEALVEWLCATTGAPHDFVVEHVVNHGPR